MMDLTQLILANLARDLREAGYEVKKRYKRDTYDIYQEYTPTSGFSTRMFMMDGFVQLGVGENYRFDLENPQLFEDILKFLKRGYDDYNPSEGRKPRKAK